MTAGSGEDLVEATIPPLRRATVEPWPTGRQKKTPPPVPGLPAEPVVARPVLSQRRRPPPIDLSAPRPRVVDDVSLLGFSRFSRGRVGSRLFTLFFVLVFAGIAVQLVFSIFEPLVP